MFRSANGLTQGSYSYVDGNGVLQKVTYQADANNGFRVIATNLPVGPNGATPGGLGAGLAGASGVGHGVGSGALGTSHGSGAGSLGSVYGAGSGGLGSGYGDGAGVAGTPGSYSFSAPSVSSAGIGAGVGSGVGSGAGLGAGSGIGSGSGLGVGQGGNALGSGVLSYNAVAGSRVGGYGSGSYSFSAPSVSSSGIHGSRAPGAGANGLYGTPSAASIIGNYFKDILISNNKKTFILYL